MTWKVEIRRWFQDPDTQQIKAYCFPYNVRSQFAYPVTMYEEPPYPGFEVLETWIQNNTVDIDYKRLYNDGSPVLELTFPDSETAFWFALEKSI